MSVLVSEYIGKKRNPAWERELASRLRKEPEPCRLQFITDFAYAQPAVALELAQKCLTDRQSFEQILHDGLNQANASGIRFWLECAVPRLGFRRSVRFLERCGPEMQDGVKKAVYWLPLFADLPGYSEEAIRSLANESS